VGFVSLTGSPSEILNSRDERSPVQRDLQILGMTFVNTMRASRPFYMGHGAEIGGEISGTSTDYAHETVAIPYTYKILLPEGGQYGFDYPARQLEALCKEMYYGFLVFGRFVRDNFRPT
jgi:Zinc carboxypeptidase